MKAEPEKPQPKGATTIIINQRASGMTLYPRRDLPLRLVPGANTVDAELWALAKEHEHVRRLLALGEDPLSREGLRDVSASATRQLSVSDALMLVRSITSAEVLAGALEGESRAVVKDAATAQGKKLSDAEARLKG